MKKVDFGSFAQTTIKKAGAEVLKRFRKDGAYFMKSKSWLDVVTKADLASEKIIISDIKKHFSAHGIIAEESGRMNENAEYVWIIDPIDGTLNFSLGVPLFCIMLALAHKKEIILSAIYVPSSTELFFAKAGAGVFLNGKKIHCSPVKDLNQSFGCGSATLRKTYASFLKNLLTTLIGEHAMYGSLGSIGLNACNVACGRRDWIVAMSGGVHDFAPVSLILKESGCTVTNTKGKPWTLDDRGIVAANPRLHKRLMKLVTDV